MLERISHELCCRAECMCLSQCYVWVTCHRWRSGNSLSLFLKKTQRRRQRGQHCSHEAGGQAAGSRKIHTWKHRERSKHKTSSVRGLWWQTHGTSEVVCFFYGLCWGLQRIGPVICSFKSHKATFTLLCGSSNLGSDLVHIICETITARSGVMAASLYIIVIKR